jgi:hypothetical protein
MLIDIHVMIVRVKGCIQMISGMTHGRDDCANFIFLLIPHNSFVLSNWFVFTCLNSHPFPPHAHGEENQSLFPCRDSSWQHVLNWKQLNHRIGIVNPTLFLSLHYKFNYNSSHFTRIQHIIIFVNFPTKNQQFCLLMVKWHCFLLTLKGWITTFLNFTMLVNFQDLANYSWKLSKKAVRKVPFWIRAA